MSSTRTQFYGSYGIKLCTASSVSSALHKDYNLNKYIVFKFEVILLTVCWHAEIDMSLPLVCIFCSAFFLLDEHLRLLGCLCKQKTYHFRQNSIHDCQRVLQKVLSLGSVLCFIKHIFITNLQSIPPLLKHIFVTFLPSCEKQINSLLLVSVGGTDK